MSGEVESLESILETHLPDPELQRAWKVLYGREYPPP